MTSPIFNNSASIQNLASPRHASNDKSSGRELFALPKFVQCKDELLIQEQLATQGVALVEGIGSKEMAVALAKSLGEIYPHRDADSEGITHVCACVLPSEAKNVGGFSRHELLPHTDRSTARVPPHYVFMTAVQQPDEGGDSLLVDGKCIWEWLNNNDPKLLAEISRPHSAVFSDGTEMHVGSIFHINPDGDVHLRFRADNLGYFSTPVAARIERVFQAIEACAIQVKLQPSQAVVVNNYRWLHGRVAFTGEREIWRILVHRLGPPLAVQGFVVP